MSMRTRLEQRRQRLMETARLLKQVPDGATTFALPGEDGKREILHNGKPTGFYVSQSIYEAVTGNMKRPEAPKIYVSDPKIYELSPQEVEEQFPTVYQYMEDCVVYVMLWMEEPAERVEVEVQRTAPDTVRWSIRTVDDGEHKEDAEPGS